MLCCKGGSGCRYEKRCLCHFHIQLYIVVVVQGDVITLLLKMGRLMFFHALGRTGAGRGGAAEAGVVAARGANVF